MLTIRPSFLIHPGGMSDGGRRSKRSGDLRERFEINVRTPEDAREFASLGKHGWKSEPDPS